MRFSPPPVWSPSHRLGPGGARCLARAWRACAWALVVAFALLLAAGAAGAQRVELTDAGWYSDTDSPHLPTGYAEPGPDHGQITLDWTPATTGPAATSWRIWYGEPNTDYDFVDLNDPSVTTHTISGLKPGTEYEVGVRGRVCIKRGPLATAVVRAARGADAGADRTVWAGTRVALDGTGSPALRWGSATPSYDWTQTAGPAVTLPGGDAGRRGRGDAGHEFDCCSAPSFDPSESKEINTLTRRSASNLRTEQQRWATGIKEGMRGQSRTPSIPGVKRGKRLEVPRGS